MYLIINLFLSSINMENLKLILGLVDLTSLNDSDDNLAIESLCKSAITKYGSVAAVCVFSQFVPLVKTLLKEKVNVATVVNFPAGFTDIELVKYEAKLALSRGADEIDLVFPYHQLQKGNDSVGEKMVQEIKSICKDKTLKVIIESGVLSTKHLIEKATIISIDNGADFIKTSTGKVSVNATAEAARIILNTIKKKNVNIGFKASGGIKTIDAALEFINLAESIMGEGWVNKNHFRFGASILVNNILQEFRSL